MQENFEEKPEHKSKVKELAIVVVFSVLLLGLSFFCWLKPEDDFSESERRILAKFPKVSVSSIVDGSFMKEFETYSLDQFPLRDGFRKVKALASYSVFQKKENNGIYKKEGYLSKVEYPLQLRMLDYAAAHFEKIYNTYLKEDNSQCYFVMIPDKNYFLAPKYGYLSLDYEELFSYMREKMYFAKNIDITGFLSLEDYYKTDTHWRQEKITDVAEFLKASMKEEDYLSMYNNENEILQGEKVFTEDKEEVDEYEVKELELPFYGVYCGQSALPVKPDTLYYLNSEVLKQCKVTSYDTGKAVETVIYNMEKAKGKDVYELFLSGTSALQVIENPMAKEERELIVFRDSFGSSLVPLLVNGYSKITVIDTRYVQSSMLGTLVDFHGQDVLFAYSTLVLNNSMSMR